MSYKANNNSLLKKINLIKKYIEHGFLLHGSIKRIKILTPFQANDYILFAGNLKAVYATNQLNFAVTKTLVTDCRNHFQTIYIYICSPSRFTKVSDNQFICLFQAVPVQAVTFNQREIAEVLGELKIKIPDKFLAFPKALGELKNKTPDKFLAFPYVLGKQYRSYANDFLKKNDLHGSAHAKATAAFGAILSQRECPDFFKEIMIGCFFHDIGRTSDYEGRIHAIKSAAVANKIIRGNWNNLNYEKIIYAIKYHADGRVSTDKIIGCIWDADRLGTIRMHRAIDLSLISTSTAKKIASALNYILNDQLKRYS